MKREAPDGEGAMSKRQEVSRPRLFISGDAISTKSNYFTPWGDFQQLAEAITSGRWLLITGAWQSGKSSLMFALAEEAVKKGYQAVVMSLSSSMIFAANDVSKNELVASDHFFDRVTEKLVASSKGTLTRSAASGAAGMTALFQGKHEREFIWFIDEASLLNDIRRPSIIQAFLSELRTVKQESVSRQITGSYHLRSFVLVGTPKLKQLIGDLRIERVDQVGEENYRASSSMESPGFDPENPLSNSISPLSMERHRPSDNLTPDDIGELLKEYRMEHDVCFFLDGAQETGSSAEESGAAISKLSNSMWGLTSGHKGMVGCCCEYLARNQEYVSYAEWKRDVRLGHVSRHIFYSKAYSRVASNITEYKKPAQDIILDCIHTGTSVSVSDLADVLRPINDGVLEVEDNATVHIANDLLLSAFLEDLSFSDLEALPEIGSFTQAIQATFAYMNHERLTRNEVLNANGQPSEYVWACEFLLAHKFVLAKGYKSVKYTIMVEAKRREKNGQRRTRLDFLLKNSGSPPKGFELQGAGEGPAGVCAIKKHVRKSVGYGKLHGCEMHYIYLQFGNCALDAKATIAEEGNKFKSVNCWFVQYLPEPKKWNVELLDHERGWISEQRDAVVNFPVLRFQKRRRL